MATTLIPDLPREFLAAARKGQEYALDAVRTWAQTVQSALPEISAPRIPFADRLPKPEAVLANAYDFAGQLLASQRHFAEELLKVTEPLMPALGNGSSTPRTPSSADAPHADHVPQTSAPATARTAPKASTRSTASAASTTRTTRTAPKASASRRQTKPKAAS